MKSLIHDLKFRLNTIYKEIIDFEKKLHRSENLDILYSINSNTGYKPISLINTNNYIQGRKNLIIALNGFEQIFKITNSKFRIPIGDPANDLDYIKEFALFLDKKEYEFLHELDQVIFDTPSFKRNNGMMVSTKYEVANLFRKSDLAERIIVREITEIGKLLV